MPQHYDEFQDNDQGSPDEFDHDRVKDDLDRGLKEMVESLDKYEVAEDYFEGSVQEKFTTKDLQRMLVGSQTEFNINLTRRVVTAVSDRLEISAITAKTVGDEGENTDAQGDLAVGAESFDEDMTKILNRDVWHANELDIEAPEVHQKFLIYGDAYLFVWQDEDGGVEIFYNSPKTTRVFYDEENPRKKTFAIKRWKVMDQGKEKVRLNIYYPNFIVKKITGGKRRGEKANDFEVYRDESTDDNGVTENPFGEIPIFHFRTSRPYGDPEHEQGYGAQDAINKLISGQMTSTDFAAFPQRWATSRPSTDTDMDIDWGEDNTQAPEDLQSNLVSGPGRVWLLDNIDKVGQFPEANADQFLKPLDKFIELMAAATGTPLSYLHKVRGTSSTPLSGKSQEATENILVKKIEARQRSLEATWREALQFAMSILGHDVLVSLKWGSARASTDKDTWEAILLKQQAGVTIRQTLLEANYTEAEVDAFGYTEDEPNGPEVTEPSEDQDPFEGDEELLPEGEDQPEEDEDG